MKVLHLSFHKGCTSDIEYVCKKLGYNLTSKKFDDNFTTGNNIYNVTKKVANRSWTTYKDFYESFDIIIVSDTTPISRTFLQNNYRGKLIIWVCNRFDYSDNQSKTEIFPDAHYYNLIRSISERENVKIFGYTPFENIYAKHIRQCDIGTKVIRPIGKCIFTKNSSTKTNKFLVPPYNNETCVNIDQILTNLEIPFYHGRYDGPEHMKTFRGIIHIPYAWSNLALFEAIQIGMIYFIPSMNFLLKLSEMEDFFWSPPFEKNYLRESEWYCKRNQNLFIYFESWIDLKKKIMLTDFEKQNHIILDFAKKHEQEQLKLWKELF